MIGLGVGLIQHKHGACNRIITIHGSIIATGLGEAIVNRVIEQHPIQSVGWSPFHFYNNNNKNNQDFVLRILDSLNRK